MQTRKGIGFGATWGLLGLPGLLGLLGACSNAGTVLEREKQKGDQDDSGARAASGGAGSQGINRGGVAGGTPSQDGFMTGVAGGADVASGGAGGDIFTGIGGGSFVPDAGEACTGQAFVSETLPAALYVMLDQSASMGDPLPSGSGTWWSAIQSAVSAMANSPSMIGTSVGVQYFPIGPTIAPASCNADYATPEVELGVLPGNADAITRSVLAHAPTAFTPTAPALQGALNHMKAWSVAHPGQLPGVVLVTDGFPTECDPLQITDIAAIARAAFNVSPPVRTFVVGLNLGVAGANLDQVAAAGGSGKAVLIDSGSIQAQFVTAMSTIAASAGVTPLLCTIQPPAAPAGRELEFAKVSIRLGQGASAQVLTRVTDAGKCQTGDGWYFADDTATPPTIDLCPHTCTAVQTGGSLQVLYGCAGP